jgi:hypothetical protein
MAEGKRERVRRTSPIGIGCFVHVAAPQKPRESDKGKDPKYSIVMSFDAATMKSDEMRALKLACIEAAEEKFGKDARDKIKKGKIAMPWRPGTDYEENGFPFDREGSYFIRFSSKEQPGVVDRKARPLEPKEIYSGCEVRVTYGVWPYDTEGNKGVTLFLNNVQLVKKGERLAGRPDASDDFEEMEGEDGSDDGDAIDDI